MRHLLLLFVFAPSGVGVHVDKGGITSGHVDNGGVQTRNWGITTAHIKKLLSWTETNQAVVILRQSEPDTLEKIKSKQFNTKSVDIKDKSSNWGPMKGLVPLDPAFCKKCAVVYGDNPPVEAYPTPDPEIEFGQKIGDAKAKDGTTGLRTGITAVQLKTDEADGLELKFDDAPDDCSHLVKKGYSFFVQRGLWFWRQGTIEAKLMVWSYGQAPVTGDYDLWMVAPFVTSPLLVGGVKDALEMKQLPVLGGVATMPDFLAKSLEHGTGGLNDVLGEPWSSDFSVFNHGAEAQNIYFTQALDDKVTVILPHRLVHPMLNAGFSERSWKTLNPQGEKLGQHKDDEFRVLLLGSTTGLCHLLGLTRQAGYISPMNMNYRAKKTKRDDANTLADCLKAFEGADSEVRQVYGTYFHDYLEPMVRCIKAKVDTVAQCENEAKEILDQQLSHFTEVVTASAESGII